MKTIFVDQLDRNSSLPLYEQVKLRLRRHIATQNLLPGTTLPTEKELCEQLGISRTTVVKALDELSAEGVIERIQGKGTLVASPKIQIPLRSVRGFSEAMRQQGLKVHSRVLSHEVVTGDPRTRAIFGMAPAGSEEFIQFRRLRFLQDKPVVLLKSTMRKDFAEELLQYPLEDASFYGLFEKITGSPVVRNEESVGISQVTDREDSRLLQVPLGSFHFLLLGASYQEGEIPLEATEAIFHGEVFRFQINMSQMVVRSLRQDVHSADETRDDSFSREERVYLSR
jgi:GntR family transcriptional regulator